MPHYVKSNLSEITQHRVCVSKYLLSAFSRCGVERLDSSYVASSRFRQLLMEFTSEVNIGDSFCVSISVNAG